MNLSLDWRVFTPKICAATLFVVSMTNGQGIPSPGDEFELLFGDTSVVREDAELQALRTLWRKIQIGERGDRQETRLLILEKGLAAIPVLLEQIPVDNLDESRNALLIALRHPEPRLVAKTRTVVSGKSRGHQRFAALCLGRAGNEDDLPHLITLAEKARVAEVQRAAIYALGRLGSTAAMTPLVQLYERENAQEVRSAILLAAGAIGGPEAAKLIEKGLVSAKETVRQAAAVGLALLGASADLELVDQKLADSNILVAETAALTLSMLSRRDVVAIIERRRLLRHRSDRMRALAATALGYQDPTAALPLLLPRMAPGVERAEVVRQALAFAFARLGGGPADDALGVLLGDDQSEVVRAAACASSFASRQSGGVAAFEALLNGTQSKKVRETGLLLFALHQPEMSRRRFDEILSANNDKKDFLQELQRIRRLLDSPQSGRALLRAEVQVQIDDLGGSAEWNVLQAAHQLFLRIEKIDRPLTGRGAGPQAGAGDPTAPRPPDRWTKEEEDMRLWFDRFPYFDRRRGFDIR